DRHHETERDRRQRDDRVEGPLGPPSDRDHGVHDRGLYPSRRRPHAVSATYAQGRTPDRVWSISSAMGREIDQTDSRRDYLEGGKNIALPGGGPPVVTTA